MKKKKERKSRCNFDCFNCVHPDCINNDRPIKAERDMMKAAMEGLIVTVV